jgi:hypothetical protein
MFSGNAFYYVIAICLLFFPACRSFDADAPLGSMQWVIPDVNPCTLITRDEAEAVVGSLRDAPKPGGSATDGTACAYIGADPFVISVGVISPNAFEMRKFDAGNKLIEDVGDEAYMTKPDAFEDVYLFARRGEAAIVVVVTAGAWDAGKTERYRVAGILAQKALDRLFMKMSEKR